MPEAHSPTPTPHPYDGLEPRELWRHFGELNRIPRPSGQEAAAREYVERVAAAHGLKHATDARGNLVVRVPATPGYEAAPAVVIQAHLDMVCERRPGVEHDFTTDPIRPRVEGDAVYATGTTLGADNGIGASAALALATEPSVVHGPLELLFTVEEETGLHGAANVDPTLVRARLMVNLDSEDPKELTVGCAGGAGSVLHLPVQWQAPASGSVAREVVVSGLKGGHSGVQIHEPLANAIKLLTRALADTRTAGVEWELSAIQGGNAHNAIPRDAAATLFVAPDAVAALEAAVESTLRALRQQWTEAEPGLALDVRQPLQAKGRVLDRGTRDRLLQLLEELPHGILAMSQAFAGKVETSSNLAQVSTSEDEIVVATSTRSFIWDEIGRVQEEIRASGERAGARVEVRDGYPGWEPDPGSRLLALTRSVYRESFGREAEVQVIHAGLECGVIVSRLPGMEAISFGPRIVGAHTPEEHVYISTVASTWKLLTALLAAVGREGAG